MELSIICLKQILIMFILVGVGVLSGKTGMIDKHASTKMSTFVLDVVNPVLIFMSYQTEFSVEMLKGLGTAAALAAASFGMLLFVLWVLLHKDRSDEAVIVRFAATYSNCAFMGIPLINGLFGSEGVLYITGYITVFNIMVWTHGVMLFGGKGSADIRKILTSPSIIAIFVGFICFVCRIQFTALADTVAASGSAGGILLSGLLTIIITAANYVSGLNTPLAMICAGVTIANTDLKTRIKDRHVYIAAALRLLVCPVLFWAVFRWFPLPEVVFMTILVGAGCPAAATGTMFALRYEKLPDLSAVIFAVTTLLSAVTLPLMVMLGGI